MQKRPIPEFISLETLCEEIIECPLATARIYASQGRLPGVKRFGSRVYVHVQTFREHLLKAGRPFIEKRERENLETQPRGPKEGLT